MGFGPKRSNWPQQKDATVTKLLSRLLPFGGQSHPPDIFVEQYQRIVRLAVAATAQLTVALRGNPVEALAAITDIEHRADDAVHELLRLVDRTFIPPYDKRDIVLLSHCLDDIVDGMRTVVRQFVSYRALEARDGAALAATGQSFQVLILRAVTELQRVVDNMPAFDHDGVRAAARAITAVEDEGDELLAQAVQYLFRDPNQPITGAMLAWRDIYGQLETVTDDCEHAIKVIVSIARQDGH